MKLDHDAYGQEIWAYLQGTESFEVVEREDGFVGMSGGARAYFAAFKDWPPCQRKAIRFAKGRILDIGCGAGRVCLYLKNKGHAVTGIDNSPLAIKVCNARGFKNAKLMPIEAIGKFKPNTFDTVTMIGNNFGLFGNFKKARLLLKKLHRITSKQAIIIAESLDPYNLPDPAHLTYQRANRRKGKMSGQLKIRIRFRRYIGDWFEYLLVSRAEMTSILKGTGWHIEKVVDSGKASYVAIIRKDGS